MGCENGTESESERKERENVSRGGDGLLHHQHLHYDSVVVVDRGGYGLLEVEESANENENEPGGRKVRL